MSTTASAIDLNKPPREDVALWSETRWNGCWCPESGAGLYIHAGRCRHDLDLWWAQTVAYLPGGRLAVDRSFGRTGDAAVVRTGNLELRALDSGWSSSFDGAGQLTTRAALARGARGSGAPSAPMRWEVTAEPVSPVWDMYGGGDGERHGFAGETHIQQSFRTTGTLTVGGEELALDGVGYKDHSSGTRGWDGYGSHRFVVGVMPGWTFHGVMLYSPEGEPRRSARAAFTGGEQDGLEVFEVGQVADAEGGPNSGEIVVKPTSGERMTIAYEVLHQCPITVTGDGDNINGIDWEAGGESIVIMEGAARLTAPDGSVGHAFFERGIPREDLAPAVDR